MESVSVIYKGTELINIIDNTKSKDELNGVHYQYVNPTINADIQNKTATFNVDIISQFECETMPYSLRTLSSFVFENFIVHKDRYEILEDYTFFAYRKHIAILTEKLYYHPFAGRIKHTLEIFQYKNSIESILYFASKDAKESLELI